MKPDHVRGHLDMLLLAVLSAGPQHGYAAIAALRERSGGTFNLPEGTVYPALHRLERAGLLASDWDDSGPRRRRRYALTPQGQAALVAQEREWQDFTTGVRAVLGTRKLGFAS
jgi:PadR family transcriptional regulator, regulatory protein PadR